MKTSIAVFDSHDKAIASIILLKEHDFPLTQVSLIGQAELVDDKIHIRSNEKIINTPVIAGSIIGTTVGLLTGIGLFAIPGFGFLFGAGAIVGAIGGFDLGLITGGIGTLLLQIGIENEYAVEYDEHIKSGKFLLMINGTQEEIDLAKKIIGEDHVRFSIHQHKHIV